jgi:sodium/hydrogen exchanger 3
MVIFRADKRVELNASNTRITAAATKRSVSMSSLDTGDDGGGLDSNQVLAPISMLAIGCTVVSVSLGVFTWRKRLLFLQDTTISMLLGAAVGAAVAYGGEAGPLQSSVVLNQTFFFYVVIPPIMFESGYAINRPRFLKNFLPIIVTAGLGVVLTSFISGAIMYSCSLIYPGGGYEDFLQSLTYAAILSATDPVSVLATFQAVPPSPDLNTVIFGEAALNDATAIIMYKVSLALTMPGATIDAAAIGAAIGQVFAILFGALGIGVLFAVIIALILKYVPFRERGSAHEAGIVLGLAYCSYVFSSFFNLSGIISIMFCGIVCSEYVIPNLSRNGHENIEYTLRSLSLFLENLLFSFLGFGFGGITSADRIFDAAVISYTFIGSVAARFITVSILIPICNLTRKRKEDRFSWREIIFVAYAGLRGGVAFVLTLELSELTQLPSYYRALCLGTTLFIIFISVVFIGGGTARTMKVLRVEYLPPSTLQSHQRSDSLALREPEEDFESRLQLDSVYARLKRNYLAPALIRKPTIAASDGTANAEARELEDLNNNTDGSLSSPPQTAPEVNSSRLRRLSEAPSETLYPPESAADWIALEFGNRSSPIPSTTNQ